MDISPYSLRLARLSYSPFGLVALSTMVGNFPPLLGWEAQGTE